MFPVLIGEGAWALPSFFTMAMVGFFCATWLARRDGLRRGYDPVRVVDLAILLLIFGVLGSRLFHVLFDGHLQDYYHLCVNPDALGLTLPDGRPCPDDATCLAAQKAGHDIGAWCNAGTGQCVPERDCLRALKFWSGGLVWYGGMIFATLFAAWFARRRLHASPLEVADMFSPSAAVALAFGRVGCFLSGCCFGEVCELPWGTRFPVGSAAYALHRETHPGDLLHQYHETGVWSSLPVHPTQLYESVSMFLIAAILWFGVRRWQRFHGQVFAWLLIAYGIVRTMLEFVRADERGDALGFSTSQWISIPLMLLGVWLLWRGSRQVAEGEGDMVMGANVSDQNVSDQNVSDQEVMGDDAT